MMTRVTRVCGTVRDARMCMAFLHIIPLRWFTGFTISVALEHLSSAYSKRAYVQCPPHLSTIDPGTLVF